MTDGSTSGMFYVQCVATAGINSRGPESLNCYWENKHLLLLPGYLPHYEEEKSCYRQIPNENQNETQCTPKKPDDNSGNFQS